VGWRVLVPDAVVAAVKAEAEAAYPYECCGFLLGPDGGALPRAATEMIAVKNEREGDPARRRFAIGPADFLAAEREAEAQGLDVVGIYHSHPDHPAAPSGTDLEQAFPWYTYIIVAVDKGAAGEVTAWRLAGDRSAFEPEEIEVTP